MKMILLLAALMQAPTPGPVQTERPNLATDGSFEGPLSDNGLPPGWEANPNDFASVDLFAQTEGRTGERGLRFRSERDWASVSSPRVARKPDGRQAAQLWYRTLRPGDGTLVVFMTYFEVDGKVAGTSPNIRISLKSANNTDAWKSVAAEHDGNLFKQATTFNLTAALSQSGDVLLDDWELHQTVPNAAPSLLKNGDMERISGTEVVGLPLIQATGGKATATAEADRPHGGKTCLRLAGDAPWAVVQLGKITIPPGKTVRGSGWQRAARGNGSFKLMASGPKGKVFDDYLHKPATAEWRETEWVLTPEKLGSATELLIEFAAGGTFDVCIDDVVVSVE